MDKKISQLTAATTPLTGTEELPLVQGGQTLKATAQDIANLGGGGTTPVLNTYPVTTSGLAGTRFWYKGNEWHYMTQDEINSTGWTGLVSVGFPAPVYKIKNDTILNNYNGPVTIPSTNGFGGFANLENLFSEIVTEFDILGMGNLSHITETVTYRKSSSSAGISKIRNANLLASLKDLGTQAAFNISPSSGVITVSATVLNNFFSDLPVTVQTATIRIVNCSGAATCNTSIATAKGYIVVTS
jgi:hypothetical protein